MVEGQLVGVEERAGDGGGGHGTVALLEVSLGNAANRHRPARKRSDSRQRGRHIAHSREVRVDPLQPGRPLDFDEVRLADYLATHALQDVQESEVTLN